MNIINIPNRLIKSIKKLSGRNNTGRITTKHRGGGNKRKYLIIDYKRDKNNIYGTIIDNIYNSNNNNNALIINYIDGEKKLIPDIEGLKIGNKIISSNNNIEIKSGNCLPIKYIPIGIKICCIEMIPNKGAIISRAAGTSSTLIKKTNKYAIIKLNSNQLKKININCRATIGRIANANYKFKTIKKAGIKRLMGIKPTVRGVAMNPIDHPHGGGEGKTSTKRQSVNRNANSVRGIKTRNNKRTNNTIINYK